MTSRFRASLRTAVALLATVLGHPAHGQDGAPAATAAPTADALTPPKLVTFVDAIYPAAAKAARLQAHVDLEIDDRRDGGGRRRFASSRRWATASTRPRSRPRAGSCSSRRAAETGRSPRASGTATCSSCRPKRLRCPRPASSRAGCSPVDKTRSSRERSSRSSRRTVKPRARRSPTRRARFISRRSRPGRFHVQARRAGLSSAGSRRGRRRGRAHVGDLSDGRQPTVE